MKTANYYTIDFETKAIEFGSGRPPEPVGVAIRSPKGASHYYAWGHPSGNNCDRETVRKILQVLWTQPVLCHNASFDLAVARDHLALPHPQTVGDSLWAAFFADPYSPTLSLKPLAQRYLGQAPEEADAVREWLVEQKIVRKSATRGWGAHISEAPGDLVGRYAIGDVERTAALWGALVAPWMSGPMERERSLLPVLMGMEARGVGIDRKRLLRDLVHFDRKLLRIEAEARQLLKAGPTLNIDSNEELADALEAMGAELPRTPTGKRAVNKAAIAGAIPDGRLKGLLLYRSALDQSLNTFLWPWAAREDGKVHVHWNSVRGSSHHKMESGARTGRLSSEPNFQNITTDQEKLLATLKGLLGSRKIELPVVRSYVVPPPGFVLVGADYSQQELRVMSHYEDGPLAAAYRKDADLDVHTFVQQLILDTTGIKVERKQTKILNFAIIYGAGLGGLAAQLGTDLATAELLRNAYFRALPSVRALTRELQQVGRDGRHITTLGGRRYFAEPARIVDGQMRTFEYKLTNYLIQGSSADQTKQAMVDFASAAAGAPYFLQLCVHDEVVVACPDKPRDIKRCTKMLREAMVEALPLDVPISVDIEVGHNWGEMHALDA